MIVEIYLHGIPDGFDVYSTSIEQDNYIKSFYASDYKDQSLIIETKIFDNSIYSYYTYFRKNILSNIGRPEGYLGLTFRIDSFVRNAQVIYQMMDLIYNRFIAGNVVSGGENKRFIVKSLKDINKKLIDQIVNLLSQILQAGDIIKLDESFLGNSGPALSFNPCDNKCVDLLNEYKKAEKIIISPSSLLPREQQRAREYQQKIEFVKKESEERFLSQMNKLSKENKSLQSDVKELSSKLHIIVAERNVFNKKICSLQAELKESRYKVKLLSEQADFKKELVSISEPLLRLNGFIQRLGIVARPQQVNQVPPRRIDTGKRFFSLILFISSVLLLGVLTFQILLFSEYNNHYVSEPKLEQLPEIGITDDTESIDNQVQAKKEYYKDAKIEIKGFSGKDGLQYGKEYVLVLSNRDSHPIDKIDGIIWNCDGGIIDKVGGGSANLRINKDSGNVRIVCHLPNGQHVESQYEIQPLDVSNISDKRSKSYPMPNNRKKKDIHSSRTKDLRMSHDEER